MPEIEFLKTANSRAESLSVGPIDVFREDHARQQKICDVLKDTVEQLVEGEEPALLLSAISFFRNELPRHILDEEEGLFPILERHASDDPRIANVLKQLRKEHEFDDDLVSFILSDLDVLARGHDLANPVRLTINIRAFAEGLKRHSSWEESVVLPLADAHLTEDEKLELHRNLAARRIAPSQ